MRIADIKGGQFQIVNSFAIRAKEEFYLIGNLVKGAVQVEWFANVQISPTLILNLRIKQLEMAEVYGDESPYVILIATANFKQVDQLISVDLNSKSIAITVEGED